RIQQLRGKIEQRKAALRKEIQQLEDQLRSAKTEQSSRISPTITIILGIVIIVVGVVTASKVNPGGFVVCFVGSLFVIIGLVSASETRRLSDKVSSVESEMAKLRSDLDQDRDSDILHMADRIRVAES